MKDFKNKRLDFQSSISDVVQVNPLFSTCKVKVLYLGDNRNYTRFTKEAVEKALPSLKNIPIVGEFSVENSDFKGHGGAIDLDDYKFVHTTKPYGIVPESAEWKWEEVKEADGTIREYLVLENCFLWTGRYEEAYSVIQNGANQSMEIEVFDGRYIEEEDIYDITNFAFSALCILGKNVEPCFESASITAYSLDKDSFKSEFSQMLKELKFSLSQEKEVTHLEKLQQLFEKYSITEEQVEAKAFDFSTIAEEELEAKVKEVFEIEDTQEEEVIDPQPEEVVEGEQEEVQEETQEDEQPEQQDEFEEVVEEVQEEQPQEEVEQIDFAARIAELEQELSTVQSQYSTLLSEVEGLRIFKKKVEDEQHKISAQEIFSSLGLSESEVEEIDVFSLSLEQIEKECYAIIGKKFANKKQFSLDSKGTNHLPINNKEDKKKDSPYGGLFDTYL